MTRLSGRRIKIIHVALLQVDGNKCFMCGRSPPEVKRLIVAHLNGDETDNDVSNYRLTCDSCNAKERYRLRKLKAVASSQAQRTLDTVRERANTSDQLPRLKPDTWSAEKSLMSELPVRTALFETLLTLKAVQKDALIAYCAAYSGCSTETVEQRYLPKLMHYLGPQMGVIKQTIDDKYGELITFRDDNDYKLSVRELLEKYPLSGSRFCKVQHVVSEQELKQ